MAGCCALARGGALPPVRAARAILVFAVSSPSVQLALKTCCTYTADGPKQLTFKASIKGAPRRERRGNADGRGRPRRPLLLQPPREGGLPRRLGARSRCFCCLDPIPPTEGGAVKASRTSAMPRGVAWKTPVVLFEQESGLDYLGSRTATHEPHTCSMLGAPPRSVKHRTSLIYLIVSVD